MHRFFLAALIVTSLGVSACFHAPPRDGRDGYDNRHEQSHDDNDNRNRHEQRSRDDDRRDQEHDGRN